MVTNSKNQSIFKRLIFKIKKSISDEFFALSPLVRLNLLAILVGIIGGIGSWIFRLAIAFIFFILFTLPQDLLRDAGLSQLDWLPFLISRD